MTTIESEKSVGRILTGESTEASALVRVEGLTKRYTGRHAGDRAAADKVSFDIAEGEFFSLLGPSGCGKSTTLRCIAGLESANEGLISIAGRTLYSSAEGINLSANRRNLGIVFQSFAIWPHMTVLQNVMYPLRLNREMRSRFSRSAAREAAQEMLEVVELGDFAARPATQLSGGQQQRLAIARALVATPRVLLLDEPLSSLDAKLRERIGVELKRLQQDLGITTIFVTHDQTEALELSDRMAVMRGGRVEQIGSPRDIYERPASAFVADFVGTSNQLAGAVLEVRDGRAVVDLGGGNVLATSTFAPGTQAGQRVVAVSRPEMLTFGKATTASDNVWSATVTADLYQGVAIEHVVQLAAGQELRVMAPAASSWAPGEVETLSSPAEAWTVFPAADGTD